MIIIAKYFVIKPLPTQSMILINKKNKSIHNF